MTWSAVVPEVEAAAGSETTANVCLRSRRAGFDRRDSARASCRWVVDLRGNGGGNMWPMLGGLRPFFGEAGLGSFVSTAGQAPLWHAGDAIE